VQFVEHFVADCMSKLYISQLMVWVRNSKYTAKNAMVLKEEEGHARKQQMNRSLPSLNIPSLCTTIFSVGSTTLAYFFLGAAIEPIQI
jgi:hypothetical protein